MRNVTVIVYEKIYDNRPGDNELVYVIQYNYILLIYRYKTNTLKALHEIYIQKNGVEFTKTSELSEPLPLPHTKGTKPAP